MKIKTGHVSNSSSTSFIVAAADRQGLKVKVELEIDLAEFGVTVYTPEELLDEMTSDGWYGGPIEDDPEYQKGLAALAAGKIVLIGNVPDSGEGGNAFETFVRGSGMLGKLPSSIEVIEMVEI